MSQEQAQRARQQLYEDVGTRDELSDDEAEVLLRWGEEQIERLAAANLDEVQFEEAFAHLSKLLTRMNRFAARRAEQAPDEQQQSLERIVESASAVGLPVVQTANIIAQAAADTLSTLQGLMNLLTPPQPAEAQSTQPTQQAIIPAESRAIIPSDSTTGQILNDEKERPQTDYI